MYRFIISLLTIFFVFVGGIARADDNNLVILDDNDTAISNPSCVADILGTSGDKIAVMTPVFEYICGAGYQPNATNDGCEPITQNCPAGTYLYINENTNVATCEPCPCGSYCAGGDLSANTENGGAVTCPTGTTTGLCSPTSPYGKGNSDVAQCSWHTCEPGQQLKVENGVASCQPCDANHYCLGGTYDAEHAGQSMQPCPTKAIAGAGTSEAGSFRCSYQCAAGQAMEVIGNWYERASDCIPCPVGSYCPGDNGAAASYFTPTVYAEGVDLNQFSVDDEIFGATACDNGQTTQGTGKTSASECATEHHCEAGFYRDITLQKCEPCANGLSAFAENVDQNLIYCPGGDFADIEDPATPTPGKVGLYLCPQYYIEEQHNNEWSTVFDPTNPDSTSDYFNIYVANGDRNACGCPDGYNWTAQGTCCKEGEFCCPRDQKVVSVSGVRTCQACSAGEDCPGTVVRVNCTPNAEENEYFNGETCVSCGAGSEPLETTGNACVCTHELLAEIYPNEPHDSDDDLVRAWNSDTNSCDYINYSVVVNYMLIESGVPSEGAHNVWSQSYNYGDEAFDVDFIPQLTGYNFVGWCKGENVNDCSDVLNTTITINPKDANDRGTSVTYYAKMVLISSNCQEGKFLNPETMEFEDCPAGSYCPGTGKCSVNNSGKIDCPLGTYSETPSATDESVCVECPNNTTTADVGATSESQCGYSCKPGRYAAPGTMVCDQICQSGDYCPGNSIFYTEAGQGRFACPEGLESDEGADNCYTRCNATEYAKKGDNGEYTCVPCDGNVPAEHAYYYCPGGKIDITLTNDGTELASEGGRYSCKNGQVSDEPASECHDGYESGTYSNNGISQECPAGYYCPGGSTNAAFKCPDGSTSVEGAGDIFDCKCLSDTALADGELPQYRPDGVYAEKGAGLFRVGDGDFVCVNTYVVVENENSFEHPGENSEIPYAGARVVACQWDETNDTYDKCTDKAMRICYENMWSDADTGLASENVTTTDVLDTLATAFETTASADMFGDPASVADIEVVGNECPAPGCSPEYPNYNDDENHCYATITYNTNGGELPEGVTNPDVYAANDLSIVLNNPVKDHYKFEGWCLEDEDDDACSANNTVTDGVVVRTIETGSGDLAFNATWSPVVYSIEYVLNRGTQAENPVTSYTVEDEDITLKDPHEDGYNFLGWYDNSEMTGTKVTTIPAGSYGNKTFWAKWERSAYMVYFDANDGQGEKDPQPCDYGQPCTISNTETGITRPDFDLVGWATTRDATTPIDNPMVQTELLPDNRITLYAVWGPVCNSRKWLHIGNQRMCLYKNKYTDTALATKIDGQTYYLNMCKDCEKTITEGSNKQLRIKYNNDVYNIYDLTAE